MSWTKGDDQTLFHPKIVRAARGGDDRLMNEVTGFVYRCVTWSGAHDGDYFIPTEIAQAAAPTRYELLMKAALRGKIVRRERGPDGAWGWRVNDDDDLFHLRSREEVKRDREASARRTRVNRIARAVRLRDGDQCRYCSRTVTFLGDRKSNRSGQYDHVDPAGGETVENIVVACGECNRIKSDRSLLDAGMTLLPVPIDPFYSEHTRQQFDLNQTTADGPHGPVASRDPQSTSGTQPAPATQERETAADERETAAPHAERETAADERGTAAAQPTPQPPARPAPDLDPSHRGGGLGTGRAGPVPPPTRPRPRDGPTRRGSRGGKRRARPPPDP